MTFAELSKDAIKYAKEPSIRHTGITVDLYLVTTLECVEYQIKKGNLAIHYNGNWSYTKEKGLTRGKMLITKYKDINEQIETV